MTKVIKVYVPLDWMAAGKAVASGQGIKGAKTRREARAAFGPVAGSVVDVSTLHELYANEVRSGSGFGKRGGKAGEADKKSAEINVGWWVKNVFPKVTV